MRKTVYEWDVETVDEHDDVVDHDHSDKCPGIPAAADKRLVLVRDVYEGEREYWDGTASIVNRSWAYVEDGELPAEFDCGEPVPARFRKELAQAAI